MSEKPMFVEAEGVEAALEKNEIEQTPSESDSFLAFFFLLGIPILILYFAYSNGALGDVLRDLFLFYGGKPEAVPPQNLLSFSTFRSLAIVASINILLSLTIMKIVLIYIGKPVGKNNLSGLLREIIREGKLFETLLFVATYEELIMRWFFLSVLSILLPAGIISLYTLILLSSIFFAGTHLKNYEDPRDRHWARVLPQFAGGFLLCFVYMKFGLIAAILVHFSENILCFTAERIRQRI